MSEETAKVRKRKPTEGDKPGRGWRGDPEGHAEAGRKGGTVISQNRAHMAEIGRRGGSKVAADRAHMAEIGRKGGSSVSRNRAHMSDIGRKGGNASSNTARELSSSSHSSRQNETE